MSNISLKELGELAKAFNDNPFGALIVVALAIAIVKALSAIRK
jgi:hypothetical protein